MRKVTFCSYCGDTRHQLKKCPYARKYERLAREKPFTRRSRRELERIHKLKVQADFKIARNRAELERAIENALERTQRESARREQLLAAYWQRRIKKAQEIKETEDQERHRYEQRLAAQAVASLKEDAGAGFIEISSYGDLTLHGRFDFSQRFRTCEIELLPDSVSDVLEDLARSQTTRSRPAWRRDVIARLVEGKKEQDMINALSMEMVAWDVEPHASHEFNEKESTLVSCVSNDRFGSVRECKNCGGREVWAGGRGSHYFDQELFTHCRRGQ